MNLNKKFFVKCSQGCVNLYGGEYGKMKKIFPKAKEFYFANEGLFKYDTEGIYYEDVRNKILHVGIKGTDRMFDWLSNLLPGKKKIPYEGVNKKIKVRVGFLDGYMLIRDWLHDIAIKHNTIVFHCHSRGVPVGCLAAVDMQYLFDKDCIVIGEGSPAFANKHFMKSYEGRVPHTFIFRNGADIVSYVPPAIFGYAYFTNIYKIGKKAKPWPNTKDHYPAEYLKAIKALDKDFF